MNLDLTDTEADLLRRVLEASLSDMRAEIGKTENYDMRQELKGDEVLLKGIIARLARGAGGPAR